MKNVFHGVVFGNVTLRYAVVFLFCKRNFKLLIAFKAQSFRKPVNGSFSASDKICKLRYGKGYKPRRVFKNPIGDALFSAPEVVIENFYL